MFAIMKPKQSDQRSRVEPTFALGTGAVSTSDGYALTDMFGGLPNTSSGAVVNETTAMQVSAVYACVSRIAGAIASMPLSVYERVDGGTRREVDQHDLWWLLNEQPCAEFGAAAWREYMVSQMLLRGDAVAYIYRGTSRNATGVEALIPHPRSQVTIQKRKMPSGHRGPTPLLYTFHTEDGFFTVDQGDVLHFPNLGFNGLTSMSAIQYGARNAIGTAMQAEEFAGKFFSQGAQPQHAITSPMAMTPSQQESFRNAWVAKYSGNGPTGIPLMLTEGLDIKELSMTAADAQLLESRKWQVIDVARAFGVPPFMIGETEKTSSVGSGVEEMGRWFVQFTLKPHLKRIQDELNRKLWPRRMRYFTEFDVSELMRGDMRAEGEYYSRAIGGPGALGWCTPNEVRRHKNLPPIEGGDKLAHQLAQVPAEPKTEAPEAKDENQPTESPSGE